MVRIEGEVTGTGCAGEDKQTSRAWIRENDTIDFLSIFIVISTVHLYSFFSMSPISTGKRSQLLSHQFAHNPELKSFLAAENTRYLSWLHEINTGDFLAVS